MFGFEMQGIAPLIMSILFLVVAILLFLMPFFVLRIRNEMIEMNRKMERLIEAVGGERKRGFFESTVATKKIKICQDCGEENKETATGCKG